MNITKLKYTPKLVKVSIDDPAIVEKYGEPVEFYMYDRYDISFYARLNGMVERNDNVAIMEMVKTLIFTSKGDNVFAETESCPLDVMVALVDRFTENIKQGQ